MDRKYTAQEMREMATEAEVIEVGDQFCGHDMDTIAAMLRQAADMMEREEKREKKYEYAQKFITESVSHNHHDTYMEAKGDTVDGYIVRREVGEWEDVKDGE